MAGRFGVLASVVLALALTVTSAHRAILSVEGGAKYDLGDVQEMHRRLMADLKTAQEKAGIFVDDAHLFEAPLNSKGRRLHQTIDTGAVFTDPNVFASFLSMLSQGLSVGSFPGAALNLPGGSPFGYSPTSDSYCLFATQPYSGAPAPAVLQPGSPLPSASGLPSGFACMETSSTSPPPGPDSFTVSYSGKTYTCEGTPGLAPSPIGRRLQQSAPSPADTTIANALAAIGLPIWNCVVSTTPAGKTTLGQATEAILNDLGVIAEHFLVYLNANGALTYEQNVINDFVSLTDPLYPSGPRLNFSIDFTSIDHDLPLLREIFGQPAPPPTGTASAAGAVAAAPNSPTTATTGSATTTSSQTTGGTSGTGTVSTTTGGQTATTTVTSPQGVVTVTVPTPAPLPQITVLTAFDGYLDNCQTVIGSAPHADGNFDRNNNFSALITDGVSNMSTAMANQYAGQVAYVIPASKAVQYAPLTLATRKTAQFCYDIATLQPTYNPLATFITANSSGMSASPASTVAAFGQAYGLTTAALTQALCISLPAGAALETYDALGEAAKGRGVGLSVLKTNVQLANLVTAGANLLTNDSSTYASYAILMDQSIGKKVLYSPPTGGRKLLQAPVSAPAVGSPACAVDLTNATTLGSIITIAEQSAPTQSDEATRAAFNQNLTPAETAAVGTAVANLNAYVATAPDATSTELAQYYAESTLAQQVGQLATGAISLANFNNLTSANAINQNLAKSQLPGQLLPTPTLSPTTTVTPVTQSSSTTSGSSGLSHGGTVALATVLPIVGVIAIVAAVAYYISRKNRGTAMENSNNSGVWWRRPFARSGASSSPRAGPSTTV